MGFEDLDVVVLRQGRGRTADQREQEVHGERHIGRDEHRLSLAETAEQPLPRCVKARDPDNQGNTRLFDRREILGQRVGKREIDCDFGLGQRLRPVRRNRHRHGAGLGDFAGIPAERRARRRCERAGQDEVRGLADRANEAAAHSSADSKHRDFGHVEVALELGDLGLVRRLVTQERIDKIAITLVRRHAARRSVRRAHEPVLFEVRDHVPDRRRRQAQPRLAGQGAGADGLAVTDVALDERAQELLRTIIRLGVDTAGRVRHKSLLQKENDNWFDCSGQTSNRTPRVSRTVARHGPACACASRPGGRAHRIAEPVCSGLEPLKRSEAGFVFSPSAG